MSDSLAARTSTISASPRRQLILLLAILCPTICGCLQRPPSTVAAKSQPATQSLPADEVLRDQLDEALDFTLQNRKLSLQDHAAWQILHGALAYQREFLVENKDGEMVSAVDHVLSGGIMRGWDVEPVPAADEGRVGLRALLAEGSKAGQGHADQWLAVLSQCDLPKDHPVLFEGKTYRLEDIVWQVQQDLPRNLKREFSWTLIGLTAYLPTDAEWTAGDGDSWSIERMVRIEAEQELASSACGGTHRLIGLTMSLQRHLQQKGELVEGWALADEVIKRAIEDARSHQNPDGSFSTNYFARPGNSPDLAQNLGASGHILEFLALAMKPEELRQPWVKRAALRMCDIFKRTQSIPLECGALYHAAHGLALYRERVFGPREFKAAAGKEN